MNEVTAQVENIINACPGQVWKSLTTPEDLKKFFFGADVESSGEMGGPIRLKGEYKGSAYEDTGEILRAEPPHVSSLSQWSSLYGQPDMNENYQVVTFTLAPAGDKTRITLSQANLVGGAKPSDLKHRADFEKN
jgi:uncharacterized protein YndB with AHSA1/START domain